SEIAAQLEAQNQVRRDAVARALEQVEERIADLSDDLPAVILGDPCWPMGIVGLVAGRITEKYARPSFVACLDAEEAKGSARSVRGVHVVKALDAAAAALRRYGGHAFAAGFSLDASRFEEFAVKRPGVERHLPRGRRIDCCFGLELDEWDGRERVRMRLRDLRPAVAAAPIVVSGAAVAVGAPA